MAKNRPAHEIRIGRIKATIWANPTEKNGTRYNVNVARLYKDAESPNDWKLSESFGRDDLLVVGKVLDMVHTWIFEQQQQDD